MGNANVRESRRYFALVIDEPLGLPLPDGFNLFGSLRVLAYENLNSDDEQLPALVRAKEGKLFAEQQRLLQQQKDKLIEQRMNEIQNSPRLKGKDEERSAYDKVTQIPKSALSLSTNYSAQNYSQGGSSGSTQTTPRGMPASTPNLAAAVGVSPPVSPRDLKVYHRHYELTKEDQDIFRRRYIEHLKQLKQKTLSVPRLVIGQFPSPPLLVHTEELGSLEAVIRFSLFIAKGERDFHSGKSVQIADVFIPIRQVIDLSQGRDIKLWLSLNVENDRIAMAPDIVNEQVEKRKSRQNLRFIPGSPQQSDLVRRPQTPVQIREQLLEHPYYKAKKEVMDNFMVTQKDNFVLVNNNGSVGRVPQSEPNLRGRNPNSNRNNNERNTGGARMNNDCEIDNAGGFFSKIPASMRDMWTRIEMHEDWQNPGSGGTWIGSSMEMNYNEDTDEGLLQMLEGVGKIRLMRKKINDQMRDVVRIYSDEELTTVNDEDLEIVNYLFGKSLEGASSAKFDLPKMCISIINLDDEQVENISKDGSLALCGVSAPRDLIDSGKRGRYHKDIESAMLKPEMRVFNLHESLVRDLYQWSISTGRLVLNKPIAVQTQSDVPQVPTIKDLSRPVEKLLNQLHQKSRKQQAFTMWKKMYVDAKELRECAEDEKTEAQRRFEEQQRVLMAQYEAKMQRSAFAFISQGNSKLTQKTFFLAWKDYVQLDQQAKLQRAMADEKMKEKLRWLMNDMQRVCFSAWVSEWKEQRFQREMNEKQKRLREGMENRMDYIFLSMAARNEKEEARLMQATCLKHWKEFVDNEIALRDRAGKEADRRFIMEKLERQKMQVAESLMRGSDTQIKTFYMKAWHDAMKNSRLERQMAANSELERMIQLQKKMHSDSAIAALSGFAAKSDSALKKSCLQAWHKLTIDTQLRKKMDDELEERKQAMDSMRTYLEVQHKDQLRRAFALKFNSHVGVLRRTAFLAWRDEAVTERFEREKQAQIEMRVNDLEQAKKKKQSAAQKCLYRMLEMQARGLAYETVREWSDYVRIKRQSEREYERKTRVTQRAFDTIKGRITTETLITIMRCWKDTASDIRKTRYRLQYELLRQKVGQREDALGYCSLLMLIKGDKELCKEVFGGWKSCAADGKMQNKLKEVTMACQTKMEIVAANYNTYADEAMKQVQKTSELLSAAIKRETEAKTANQELEKQNEMLQREVEAMKMQLSGAKRESTACELENSRIREELDKHKEYHMKTMKDLESTLHSERTSWAFERGRFTEWENELASREEEIDALATNLPEQIKAVILILFRELVAKHYNEKISEAWRIFMAATPSKVLTKHIFEMHAKDLIHPGNPNRKLVLDQIWRAFDGDKSGNIEFEEFCYGLPGKKKTDNKKPTPGQPTDPAKKLRTSQTFGGMGAMLSGGELGLQMGVAAQRNQKEPRSKGTTVNDAALDISHFSTNKKLDHSAPKHMDDPPDIRAKYHVGGGNTRQSAVGKQKTDNSLRPSYRAGSGVLGVRPDGSMQVGSQPDASMVMPGMSSMQPASARSEKRVRLGLGLLKREPLDSPRQDTPESGLRGGGNTQQIPGESGIEYLTLNRQDTLEDNAEPLEMNAQAAFGNKRVSQHFYGAPAPTARPKIGIPGFSKVVESNTSTPR